ncbi:CBS domain-containing protein [Nocardiopsis composta]|uniref:CBS domain-containing protein n=1 Tax=Nocardiopsis composta TaxID=157465 RepID=A0A7W8QIJ8_9ACTN|nr:CBS domain-containing protein [Nocardiopsis composta]MBB5431143.1 CBS domain-containing protein [Nocardiopsis composta]
MRGTVGDVMTGGAASVPEGAGYRRIAQVMLEQGVGALPVTDAAGRVVGVVTEGDLPPREGAGAENGGRGCPPPAHAPHRGGGPADGGPGEGAAEIRAAELMTRPAATVEPSAPVAEAARIMERRGVERLPVVDARGVLLGTVDRRDLPGALPRADADIAREIGEEIAASLPNRSEVTVSVRDGAVELGGLVPDPGTAEALKRRSAGVEGMLSVSGDGLEWPVDGAPV